MTPLSSGEPWCIVPHATQIGACQLAQITATGEIQRAEPELPFPFAQMSNHRLHALNEHWAVGILRMHWEDDRCRLFRARRTADGTALERLPDVELLLGMQVNTLLLHGDWLYLGGRLGFEVKQRLGASQVPQEYFGRLYLPDESAQPVIEMLPLPVQTWQGKEIDDLRRDEHNRLLVLDDVVDPKYLFVYQLRDGNTPPSWLETHRLPFGRPTEKYKRADWNDTYIVLLSYSAHMGGVGSHLSVLRRTDMQPIWQGTIALDRKTMYQDFAPRCFIADAVLHGNNLLLFAAGPAGLGSVQLQNEQNWPRCWYNEDGLEMRWSNRRQRLARWRRFRTLDCYWAEAIDLKPKAAAPGISWLPTVAGQAAHTETIQVVSPGLLLLTGRNEPGGLQVCWTRTLP